MEGVRRHFATTLGSMLCKGRRWGRRLAGVAEQGVHHHIIQLDCAGPAEPEPCPDPCFKEFGNR